MISRGLICQVLACVEQWKEQKHVGDQLEGGGGQDFFKDIAALLETVDYALLDATFFADGELGNRDMSQIPHPFVAE